MAKNDALDFSKLRSLYPKPPQRVSVALAMKWWDRYKAGESASEIAATPGLQAGDEEDGTMRPTTVEDALVFAAVRTASSRIAERQRVVEGYHDRMREVGDAIRESRALQKILREAMDLMLKDPERGRANRYVGAERGEDDDDDPYDLDFLNEERGDPREDGSSGGFTIADLRPVDFERWMAMSDRLGRETAYYAKLQSEDRAIRIELAKLHDMQKFIPDIPTEEETKSVKPFAGMSADAIEAVAELALAAKTAKAPPSE